MPSILVVDDTAVDRCLVEGILKRDPSYDVTGVSDARSAIVRIESHPTDVVVTDLQMPEMSGLDLVTVVRERFPGVPVVLVTAHGSEELAVRALAEGAASYVPKTQLADRLLPTISQVLDSARVDRGYVEFQQCLQDARLRFEIKNQPHLITHLADVTSGMAGSIGLCDAGEKLRMSVAIQGLLEVCYFAGNLELPMNQLNEVEYPESAAQKLVESRREVLPYRSRRLTINFDLTNEMGTFAVRHEGPAFDSEQFGTNRFQMSHDAPRSLVLFHAFGDHVALQEGGQLIVMVRHRRRAPHRTVTTGH